MDLNLDNKVAIVTGAGRGIGLAIATTLVREGASVAAASLTETEELAALAGRANVVPVIADIAAPDGPQTVVAGSISRFGGVDILVNNVGAFKFHPGGFMSITDDDWQRTLALNLVTTVRMTRAVLPHMLERNRGTIVNISSVNARQPGAEVADYSAAKAAVTNLTKIVAEEFGPKGIRANAVAPGPVSTQAWVGPGGVAEAIAAASETTRESVVAHAAEMNSMVIGRMITGEEVAELVAFLASDCAAAITGAEYLIEGGMVKAT